MFPATKTSPIVLLQTKGRPSQLRILWLEPVPTSYHCFLKILAPFHLDINELPVSLMTISKQTRVRHVLALTKSSRYGMFVGLSKNMFLGPKYPKSEIH